MEIEKDIKKYEIGFLGKSDAAREEIVKLLADYKAEIFDNGNMLMIKLAYPIKKENSAYFGYLYFSAYPNIIKNIEDSLKLSQQVLRFMVIASPEIRQSFELKSKMPPSEIKIIRKVEPRKPKVQVALSNEALEKKLEEILK